MYVVATMEMGYHGSSSRKLVEPRCRVGMGRQVGQAETVQWHHACFKNVKAAIRPAAMPCCMPCCCFAARAACVQVVHATHKLMHAC